jgi:hypothetical protein
MFLAARHDMWPGEQRLLLPGNKLWTSPALPVELEHLGWNGEVTVQLVRYDKTRSILAPPELLRALHERIGVPPPIGMVDDWFRDLGEPAGEVFLHCPQRVASIGYVGMARVLLIRRRMHELLPMVRYDPAVVLRTMLEDDAWWLEFQQICRDAANKFIKFLDKNGVLKLQALINLGYLCI